VSGLRSEGAEVVDVRSPRDFAAGHLPGALHLELGTLMSHLPDLPSGPTVVMCGHGERAMSAASLLQRAGRADLAVLHGGPDDWATATGRALESTQ
jgi:hydroxyacylglutathione hydrolase